MLAPVATPAAAVAGSAPSALVATVPTALTHDVNNRVVLTMGQVGTRIIVR